MSVLTQLKNGDNNPIFDQLNEELIEDYLKGSPCLEFEESMIITLFDHRKYDVILSCFRRGFKWNPKYKDLILKSGNLALYQYLMEIHEFPTETYELLIYPVRTNNLETVIWLASTVNCQPTYGILALCIRREHWDIYKWLYLKYQHICFQHLDFVVQKGNLEILEWCLQNSSRQYEKLFLNAIQYNQIDIFNWGIAHGYPVSSELYIHALNHNNFEIVKILFLNCPWAPRYFYYISNQNRHICKWLLEQGCPFPTELSFPSGSSFLAYLTCIEDLELIKFVVERGARISNEDFIVAARFNVSIMQYFYDTMPREEMNLDRARISYEAAAKSNLEILNWLEATGILPERSYEPENPNRCVVNGALVSGNLEIFRWVKNRCYKGSSESLDFAIKYGWNLDIIKELREEGCPFHKNKFHGTFQKALTRKDFEIIKYLVDCGCPYPKSDKCFKIFCDDNNLDILEWFLSKGFPTGSQISYDSTSRACAKACETNQFKAFKWFVKHDFQWSVSFCYRMTSSKEIRDWIDKGRRKYLKYKKFAERY